MAEQALLRCPLFAGAAQNELDSMLECLGALRRKVQRDEFIFAAGLPAIHIGIVLSGGVNVVQEDYWGGRAILAHIGPGGLFGESFACAGGQSLPVSVVATAPTEVLLLEAQRLVSFAPATCAFQPLLAGNLLRILANKNISLTQKLEHISGRTIREKLLRYLSAQAVGGAGGVVTLPFNRQELADYLGVERSALSRELSQMKRDGLLDYHKNRFVLN